MKWKLTRYSEEAIANQSNKTLEHYYVFDRCQPRARGNIYYSNNCAVHYFVQINMHITSSVILSMEHFKSTFACKKRCAELFDVFLVFFIV